MLALLAAIGWPVLDRFRFGSVFAISPHGLWIAIGFMIGAWLVTRLALQRGIPFEAANAVVFWSLIGAIVGARVGYLLAHYSEFSSPIQWFEIWKGGISLLGGIAGATIANAVSIKRARFGHLRFFQVADNVAPGLALGIAIGRIGDLIIGDHLGRPTSWLLAWQYKGGTLAPPFVCADNVCQAQLQGGHVEIITRAGARLLDQTGKVIATGNGVHQTALYDMLLAWVLFGVLWTFIRKDRREGIAALIFAAWYGCNRLLEDSLRIDKRFGPLTGSQWTALVVVLVSIGLLVYFAVSKRPGATTPARARLRQPPPEAGADAGDPPEGPEPEDVSAPASS
ncbi:MAG: prolipoprotein diacylglyceryl transferase [Planctomycetaceae bacterium]